MTLFSVENSKSMNLIPTPHGNRGISIVHRTESQVLVRPRGDERRIVNLGGVRGRVRSLLFIDWGACSPLYR